MGKVYVLPFVVAGDEDGMETGGDVACQGGGEGAGGVARGQGDETQALPPLVVGRRVEPFVM